MDIKPILESALAIVESAWTDKAKAVDAEGNIVLPWAGNAVAWNSQGAIYKAVGNDLGTVFPLRALAAEFNLANIDFSDIDKVYGKDAIISAYANAIEKAS